MTRATRRARPAGSEAKPATTGNAAVLSERPTGERKRDRDTRQMLLDAAWTLFSEKGFTRTTVDDIVGSCGLSRGTFYIYFKNKTAIFETLAEEVVTEMNASAARRAAPGSSDKERIRFSNEEYLRFYGENRQFLRELVTQSVSNDELSGFEAKLRQHFVVKLSRAMKRALDAGDSRDVDPELMTHILSGMVYWFAYDWLGRGSIDLSRFSLDEIVDTLTEVWYHALYPDSPRAGASG